MVTTALLPASADIVRAEACDEFLRAVQIARAEEQAELDAEMLAACRWAISRSTWKRFAIIRTPNGTPQPRPVLGFKMVRSAPGGAVTGEVIILRETYTTPGYLPHEFGVYIRCESQADWTKICGCQKFEIAESAMNEQGSDAFSPWLHELPADIDPFAE